MKRILKVLFYLSLFLVLLVFVLGIYVGISHEPNWHVESNAVRSNTHPLAGFWKDENCKDDWGWAIGPAGKGIYYVSFCGPGGCFEEGTYRNNTTIYDDPKYNVVDEDAIDIWSQSGWSTIIRCPGRTR